MHPANEFDVPENIFRAYDIRGIAFSELSEEVMYLLGRAIATKLLTDTRYHEICLARDGRLSSDPLALAFCSGLTASGADVCDMGTVPTPLLYFATHHTNIRSGAMLTGSHNPKDYNGLKIVFDQKTLKENDIQSLLALIYENAWVDKHGNLTEYPIIPAYIQAVTKNITLARPLKVVIDCGNGVTGVVAPELYRALGCEVIELFSEIDGNFPNHHPDPGQPKNMAALQQAVVANKADIGLAFDGDGDRLGAVTNTGDIIWPDRILMLFAQSLLSENPGATIMYDVKCSQQVSAVIQKLKGQPLIWKTGHALIKSKLQETGALLAGEMSGHFFFKDRWFGFDDALYAGARLIEIVAQSKLSANLLFQTFRQTYATPELNIAIKDVDKFNFVEEFCKSADFPNAQCITIDGLRVEYPDGFGLLRASNTTPNLVLRFEGISNEALNRIQESFRKQILMMNPRLNLPF